MFGREQSFLIKEPKDWTKGQNAEEETIEKCYGKQFLDFFLDRKWLHASGLIFAERAKQSQNNKK